MIFGMGELHFEVIVNPFFLEFKVVANVGRPQVGDHETISREAQAQGKHVRQTGGHGQYGDVWVRGAPKERGKGFEFINAILGGGVPKEDIKTVEKGLREALENGIISPHPILPFKTPFYDVS